MSTVVAERSTLSHDDFEPSVGCEEGTERRYRIEKRIKGGSWVDSSREEASDRKGKEST